MLDKSPNEKESTADKAAVTLPGTVEKIIPPVNPVDPEKAQISVEGAEELYREIRIDNVLEKENGETVSLKRGAKVEITVEAEPEATKPTKTDSPAAPSPQQTSSDKSGHAA